MHLPFPAVLALRYLKSTRKDAFVSFLSLVAGIGLALGVAALILALAALSGFQTVLVAQVLRSTPHVEVELPAEVAGEELGRRVAAIEGVDGVEAAYPTVRGQGWLLTSDRGVELVQIVGFEGRLPPSVGARERREAEPGLYVSERVAARWDLSPGQTVEVASPRPTLTPFGGPQPRVRSVPLAGLVESAGQRPESERAAVPLAIARSLFSPVPTVVEVDAGDFSAAAAVAERIRGALPEATVRSWQDLHRPLFFVLRLEKTLIFIAVFLIVVVAALALVASLSLLIANKRGEIGMLGALGATPRSLALAFLLLGALLGLAGAGLGGALGAGAAVLLDRFGAVPLPGGVYFVDHVPFRLEPRDVASVLLSTLGLALAASLYAARRVAGMTPLEMLRR